MRSSLVESLISLPPQQREKAVAGLSPAECEAILYDWRTWARPKQLAPDGDWSTWLVDAGRGFGKTRCGAEWIREQVELDGRRSSLLIHLVGATTADVRDVMVNGPSGIIETSPSSNRPTYFPSKRLVVWPNGAKAICFSAEQPNRLRGPQCHIAWADEIAAWKYPETWDQLQFGLRLKRRGGLQPQAVATTTPRPIQLVRGLLADAKRGDGTVVVTHGSTFENKANLAKTFLRALVDKYQGTRLGRQELEAEMLDDNPGALWQRSRIDELRLKPEVDHSVVPPRLIMPEVPALGRIVVAVDPAVTNHAPDDQAGDGKRRKRRLSNETGILIVGLARGLDSDRHSHAYVLEDKTGRYSPNEWAQMTVDAYRKWKADAVVAEVNNGGDLVESNIRNLGNEINVVQVRASRGKHLRAEPVAALYEQGRVHHVGTLAALEDQMCSWDPSLDDQESPDRVDSLVWALTDLIVGPGDPIPIQPPRNRTSSRWGNNARGF